LRAPQSEQNVAVAGIGALHATHIESGTVTVTGTEGGISEVLTDEPSWDAAALFRVCFRVVRTVRVLARVVPGDDTGASSDTSQTVSSCANSVISSDGWEKPEDAVSSSCQ
jgi:hypothetical protein